MRELPRQLSAAELTPLFSGRTRLVDELAAREEPLAAAEEVARVVDGPARQEFARFFASGRATAGLNAYQRTALLQQYLKWRRSEAAAIR